MGSTEVVGGIENAGGLHRSNQGYKQHLQEGSGESGGVGSIHGKIGRAGSICEGIVGQAELAGVIRGAGDVCRGIGEQVGSAGAIGGIRGAGRICGGGQGCRLHLQGDWGGRQCLQGVAGVKGGLHDQKSSQGPW